MVVWHHITGYILFTILAILSLSFLLDYLETDRTRAADASVLLAIGAAFTYELGSVYCLLAALARLVSAIRLKRATRDHVLPSDPRGVRQRIRLATMLTLVPVLYETVSLLDFFARLGSVGSSGFGVRVPQTWWWALEDLGRDRGMVSRSRAVGWRMRWSEAAPAFERAESRARRPRPSGRRPQGLQAPVDPTNKQGCGNPGTVEPSVSRNRAFTQKHGAPSQEDWTTTCGGRPLETRRRQSMLP